MKSSGIKKFLNSKIFTLIILLALLLGVFGIASRGQIFIPTNLRLILNASVTASFVVTGVGLLLIFGDIDLSSAAVGTLAAMVMSILHSQYNWPVYVAIPLCLFIGLFCGFINAVCINELKFQPFIATLAMAKVAEGLMNALARGNVWSLRHPFIVWIGDYRLFGVLPFNNLLAMACLLIYGFVLAKTEFGRKIYLCGSNRGAARLAGINPKKISYFLFMNCGALSALAAFILSARIHGSSIEGISSFQFTAITAALLGGVTFGGGGGSIIGCLFGILIINVFQNALTVLSVNVHLQTIFNGMILVIALTIDIFSARRQKRAILRETLKS
jgi:ribose/xylose/arabinose/galactoside ABC-type transport system permease subunit